MNFVMSVKTLAKTNGWKFINEIDNIVCFAHPCKWFVKHRFYVGFRCTVKICLFGNAFGKNFPLAFVHE